MSFKITKLDILKILDTYDVALISVEDYLPDRSNFKTQNEYKDAFRSILSKYGKLDSRALIIKLKTKNYGVIKIKSKEKLNTYLVFNRNNNKNFKVDILELADKCNSFNYIPKNFSSENLNSSIFEEETLAITKETINYLKPFNELIYT